MVGAAIFLRYADIRAAKFLRNSAFEICDYVNHHLGHYGNCWHDVMNVAAYVDDGWTDIAMVSLAPILFGWLVIFITMSLWQWLHSSHR